MIHVNRADGKHEILSKEEFEQKYGKLPQDGPHIKDAQKLRDMRVLQHIGLREMAKAMDVLPSWLSRLEHGGEKVTPAIKEAYLKGLLSFDIDALRG